MTRRVKNPGRFGAMADALSHNKRVRRRHWASMGRFLAAMRSEVAGAEAPLWVYEPERDEFILWPSTPQHWEDAAAEDWEVIE